MPESLANQIAAGEVVERPASVVKELVENAIDAESTEIIIELVEAGIQQIKITDNGIGMDQEDLNLAFLAHATSKLYDVNDLFNIRSLGFRGEALASIASVSKVRVDSKIKEAESANYIEIHASELVSQGISQARQGTSIVVDSLFYNTPARLKHLKTIKTELSHSLRFIQNISLSHPEIRLRLYHNGQQIFSSSASGDLRQAIANVYQPSVARDLIEIKASSSDFSIHGYISSPKVTRTNKQSIHWIINGRVVRSYWLDQVLIKTYGKQLMIGRYPIAIINIHLDSRLIDVNVHPTKQTVRLSKEEELSALLSEALQESLMSVNPVPELRVSDVLGKQQARQQAENTEFNFSASNLRGQSQENTDRRNHYHESLQSALNNASNNKSYADDLIIKESNPVLQNDEESTNESYSINFHSLRYVGQIHGTYLIAESHEGFYLIDQHAAQERIRYEQLMEEEVDLSYQQQLLMPLTINFSSSEMEMLSELLEKFKGLGIYLEEFGPNYYKLESYPNWIRQDELPSIIHDIFEMLVDNPNLTISQIRERSIIMQSCRGAIKANHYLDERQAIALIQDLDGLIDPYHCPHGRPIFVEFNEKTLEKLFKRIQDKHERGIYR